MGLFDKFKKKKEQELDGEPIADNAETEEAAEETDIDVVPEEAPEVTEDIDEAEEVRNLPESAEESPETEEISEQEVSEEDDKEYYIK